MKKLVLIIIASISLTCVQAQNKAIYARTSIRCLGRGMGSHL